MAIACVENFVEAVCASMLLDDARRQELLNDLQQRHREPRDLARVLLQRNWLTPYQVNQLFQGHGADLTLGQYVLLERLGEGGMGQVFKARHRSLGRVVALKVIRRNLLENPKAIARFQREVQAAAQLTHPHIVHAFDADQAGGLYFFAMEYVQGIDLARLIKEKGPLAVPQACDYIRQAALGLQHAFERGLVHRDIKPANLLVAGLQGRETPGDSIAALPRPYPDALRWGIVKILDMGLARLDERADRADSTLLTQIGSVMGTPDFIAPEQARNSHRIDIRADLYSLGCTLYFLLSGQPPFPHGTLAEKLLHHQLDEPEPVELVRRTSLFHQVPAVRPSMNTTEASHVPEAVQDLLRRLMAKRPDNRFQTPAELAEALTEAAAKRFTQKSSRALSRPSDLPPTPQENAIVTGQTAQRRSGIRPIDPTVITPPPRRRAKLTMRMQRPDLTRGRLLSPRTRGLLVFGGFCLLLVLFFRFQWQEQDRSSAQAALALEQNELQKAWHVLQTRFHDPKANAPLLAREVVEFRARYWGSKEGRRAAELLMQLPSPLDRAEQLPAARSHLPWLARDVVAVLGSLQQFQKEPALCVAFSPDGRLLARGGADGKVRLWDTTTLREIVALPGQGTSILTVAFSPDGRLLAFGGLDGAVHLWEVATGRELRILTEHKFPVSGLVFAPDGRRLATASWDGTVLLWDVASGNQVLTVPGREDNRVFCLAFAPDGQTLAAGYEDDVVRLWRVAGKKAELEAVYSGNTCRVKVVAFAPDSRTLVSGGGDGTLRLCRWDGRAFHEHAVLNGHRHVVHAAAFSPNGKLIISGSEDRSVKLWDAASGRLLRDWHDLRWFINGVAFAPDGRHVATANGNDSMYLLRISPPPALQRPRTNALRAGSGKQGSRE
jgi:serine/threonine-protein kinase